MREQEITALFSTTSIKERPCEDTGRQQSASWRESLTRNQDPAATVDPGAVQPPELWENKFLLFKPPGPQHLSSGSPETFKMHCTSLSFLYWLTSCVSKEIQGAVCSKLPDKSNWLTFTQYRKKPQGHKTLIKQWPNLWARLLCEQDWLPLSRRIKECFSSQVWGRYAAIFKSIFFQFQPGPLPGSSF